MKLLLFSDLHCSTRAARTLVERAKNADIVIGAGDFGVARRRIADTINVLRAIDKPAILVPGNAESDVEGIRTRRPFGRIRNENYITYPIPS